MWPCGQINKNKNNSHSYTWYGTILNALATEPTWFSWSHVVLGNRGTKILCDLANNTQKASGRSRIVTPEVGLQSLHSSSHSAQWNVSRTSRSWPQRREACSLIALSLLLANWKSPSSATIWKPPVEDVRTRWKETGMSCIIELSYQPRLLMLSLLQEREKDFIWSLPLLFGEGQVVNIS